MIREFNDADLNKVMSIWLDSNLDAHFFIDADYWKKNFDIVKAMIPQSEVYVSEDNGIINGFIGIIEDYIAGIFVKKSDRSRGIGTALLDLIKKDRQQLSLAVYENNKSAIEFYKNAGFKIELDRIDKVTLQKEYIMKWKK